MTYQVDIRHGHCCAFARAIRSLLQRVGVGCRRPTDGSGFGGARDPADVRVARRPAEVRVARRPAEHRVEHRAGYPAGECVLLARVIAAEHEQAGDHDLDPVTECGPTRWNGAADPHQLTPRRLPGEMAKADDGLDVRRHQIDFSSQPRLAGVALGDCGFVLRRCTPDGGHHPDSEEPLTVVGGDARPASGQPATPQRLEQEVAAAIAGEDPAGPVAAVGCGREPDDHHGGPLVAPAGNRAAPVLLAGERTALGDRHLLAPFDQARACPADRLPGDQIGQRFGTGRQPADGFGAGRDGSLGRRRVARPPVSRGDRSGHRGLGALAPVTIDQAMPSSMSCSLATISSKPNLRMIRSRIKAPAPITSTRPGWITLIAARCSWSIPSKLTVTSCTRAALSRAWWIRAGSYWARFKATAVSVVTEPANPTRVCALATGTASATAVSATSLSRVAAVICSLVGGSPCRCRSVSRTQPTSTEIADKPPLELASGPPSTNSVDPPPMSTTRNGGEG